MEREVPAEGVYVVCRDDDGRYWDGEGWVRDWKKAKWFTPVPRAYQECKAQADAVGVPCCPCKICVERSGVPPEKRSRRKRPEELVLTTEIVYSNRPLTAAQKAARDAAMKALAARLLGEGSADQK